MQDVKIGLVGCEKQITHSWAWAELMSGPEGASIGMRVAKVWDTKPDAAQAFAQAFDAQHVSDLAQVGEGVDGVLITEPLPDRFPELGRPFLEAGQRVFFNRPFAASMDDAREIVRLAEAHDARIYSGSALHYTDAGDKAREKLAGIGDIRIFNATGPTGYTLWYLPHVVACLYNVLGPGVSFVRTLSIAPVPSEPNQTSAPIVAYAEYGPDSPIGSARGVLEMTGPDTDWYGFRLKVYGTKDELEEVHYEVSYVRLLQTMAEFFRTGVEPFTHEELLEQMALVYAILRSAELGGAAVRLADI